MGEREGFVIGCASRLIAGKGLRELLNAFARVVAEPRPQER